MPANGQGVLGIEVRSDDDEIKALLEPLQCSTTRYRVLAERAMNRRLQGGCQVPIGAFAVVDGDRLSLRGLVGDPDGVEVIREEIQGPVEQAEALGIELAEKLLARGAGEILKAVYDQHD